MQSNKSCIKVIEKKKWKKSFVLHTGCIAEFPASCCPSRVFLLLFFTKPISKQETKNSTDVTSQCGRQSVQLSNKCLNEATIRGTGFLSVPASEALKELVCVCEERHVRERRRVRKSTSAAKESRQPWRAGGEISRGASCPAAAIAKRARPAVLIAQ